MVKGAMTFSLSTNVCNAIDEIVKTGRYKSKSRFVEVCILEHFEPEFPDLEGEAAFKRADELEFAAASYREQAVAAKKKQLDSEVVQLTKAEEEIFKATATPAAPIE